MKILTYNLRYDNPLDGINSWENRKKRFTYDHFPILATIDF